MSEEDARSAWELYDEMLERETEASRLINASQTPGRNA
jgi:hypothetical protein